MASPYDVVVYLSSLPRIADRNRKIEVLHAFARGAQAHGARVLVQTEYEIVNARLAVILGWVGTKLSGQHIQLRQNLIRHQLQTHNHIMPIDSTCFKFVDHDSRYLRYSLGGVFYNTNNYANKNSTSQKWQEIQKSFPQLQLSPWRTAGNHILLCLQRDGGWSMKGTNLQQWAYNAIQTIRQFSSRPILVRPHPKVKTDVAQLLSLPGVSESRGTTLQQDLAGAWASVFYNSSSSVAAVLAGIPVFAHDPDCVAWNVSNSNLANIETPAMPERESWLYDLASAHWSDAESQQGLVYQKFLQYL